MQVPRTVDIKHKNQLFRLLRALLLNRELVNELMFKGGTYAALINQLDRFSIDLDFDLPNKGVKNVIRPILYDTFNELGFEIKDESKNYLQFFLKYPAPVGERNTLKLDINDTPSRFNVYQKVNLTELNILCNGHTPDTMFANKLIAAKARFDKNEKIAGRDFYDLHVFFTNGLSINKEVVEDLSQVSYEAYIQELIGFIEKEVSDKLLNEDLNPLLDTDKLKRVLPHLKIELLRFLRGEVAR